MEESFNFRDLFVFDMANNHQGSVEHGLAITRGVGEVARKHGVRAGLKFQFRQLDSFVHPAHRSGSDNKHIPRFLSTRLSPAQYETMRDAARKEGMLTICTPFDEESVDLIVDMGFDILKIASCSARDWPLLEKAAAASLPIIASTGGLTIGNIDDLVSFFEHRGVDFALMHCVSIYPTPDELCQLNQIDVLRARYANRVIGWSTHENPDDTAPVMVALAKGAEMFERHVGIETDKIKLNAYSSTPEQLDHWIAGYKKGKSLCGSGTTRTAASAERESIDSLRRGVYARTPIKAGSTIGREQVYFAMPYVEGQLESGAWKDGIVANAEIAPDGAVAAASVSVPGKPKDWIIKQAVHEVKAMLNEARIALNSEFEVEYSHHYGVENFREIGAIIINCINRDYCKKIIVQLPNQKHPLHFHKRKEETFQVLHGTLEVNVDGHDKTLRPGEGCLIQPGVWHSFKSKDGCIFEEISTTHFNDDSFYKDKSINQMARSSRKTVVDHWGRYEIEDSLRGVAAPEPVAE
jgi:sialic acid synthase SpsE/mannose-6-phosphate isomerase-like protein (cupin superfamily)